VTLDAPTLHGQRITRELVLMAGSHHMHVFWYESDFAHTPAQLPILYLIDQDRTYSPIPKEYRFLNCIESSRIKRVSDSPTSALLRIPQILP